MAWAMVSVVATDPKHYVGRVFAGRYLIERPLAEGGMGAVFEATQTSLGRKVAIKVVKSTFEGDDEAMKRFQREAEAVARLQHPHIVTVVDAGRAEDGTLFLAMELLTGETVRAALRREHHFPWPRALAVIEDVAAALMAAHEAGVIHRDLKAENVMLTRAAGRPEHAKVLDFGVAKLTEQTPAPPVTGSGFVAGTPGFIAPEQMLGKSDEPRSDLYSLGVLLFELLAGRAPFVGGSGVELMMRHLTEPAPRVADVAREGGIEVPGPVDELCASLLSKDPDERPPSATALLQIVRTLRESAMATMPSVRTPPLGGTSFSLAPALATVDDVRAPSVSAPAARAPGAPDAPTQATPMATAAPVLPVAASSKRKTAKAAAAAMLLLGLGGAAWAYSNYRANRLATNDEGERAVAKAVEAVWQADTALAGREAERALRVDPGATGAAAIRAFTAIADGQPLARFDQRIGEARTIARHAAVGGRSHALDMIERLAKYDLDEAQREMREHSAVCNDTLEAVISAERLTYFEVRPETIRELFSLVKEPSRPMVRLGLVRADLAEGTPESLARARAELDALEREVPSTAPLVRARVNLALAEGNVDEAIERLRQWTLQNGDDLAARRRLLILLARGRGTRDAATDAAFQQLLDNTRARVDELAAAGGERAVDELAEMGATLAVLGRMREAATAWQRALALAGADHRIRAEMLAVAALLSRLQADFATAQSWSDQILKEVRQLPATELSRARGELVWHALNVMKVADQKNPDVDSVRGSAALVSQVKKDVPMLVDTARWYFAIAEGDLEEARRLAEGMSHCMRPTHLARLAFVEAELASDDATRTTRLQAADQAFTAATTDALRLRCTLGNDVPSQAMSLAFGELLLRHAMVAVRLRAPDAAARVERAAAYWSGADEEGRPQRALAELRLALAGTPATP